MFRCGYQHRVYFPKFADTWCREKFGERFFSKTHEFERFASEDDENCKNCMVEYECFSVFSEPVMAYDLNTEVGESLRYYFKQYLDAFKQVIAEFQQTDDRDTRLALVPFIVDYIAMQIHRSEIAGLSTELDGIHVSFRDGTKIVRGWDFFIRKHQSDFDFCNNLNILESV